MRSAQGTGSSSAAQQKGGHLFNGTRGQCCPTNTEMEGAAVEGWEGVFQRRQFCFHSRLKLSGGLERSEAESGRNK